MVNAVETGSGKPPVSAVIVNYNAGPHLTKCVDSALSQMSEILVVDNASSDSSIDVCAQRFSGEPSFKIIQNNVNLGFAAACNIGFSHSRDDFVMFLNPDCCLAEGAVAELLGALRADVRAGMVGSLLVNPDGSEQRGGRRVLPTPWRSFVRAFGLSCLARRWPRLFFDFNLNELPLPTGPTEVDAITGACMLVKREAIDNVGLWDEGYFLHCEDLDWCMRFKQKGWKVMFVPNAKVVHHKGACSRSRPFFVEWHKHRGMLRFYRKFYRDQYPALLWALVVVGVWLRFTMVSAYYAGRIVLANVGIVRG